MFEDDPPYETFLLLFISDTTRVGLGSFGMAIAIAGVVGPGKVALGKLDLTEVLSATICRALFLDVLTSRSNHPHVPLQVLVGGLKIPISTLMDMSVLGVVVSKNRVHYLFFSRFLPVAPCTGHSKHPLRLCIRSSSLFLWK